MRIFSDRWLLHPVFVFWIQELPRQDVAWVSRTGCSLCVWHELQSSDMWLVKYQLLHSAHAMQAAECWGRYLWERHFILRTDHHQCCSGLHVLLALSCCSISWFQWCFCTCWWHWPCICCPSQILLIILSTTLLFFMALHPDLISTAYESHEGVLQTKQWLSELYWWLNMDTEVINAIHFCHLCQLIDQFYLCQMAHGISLL